MFRFVAYDDGWSDISKYVEYYMLRIIARIVEKSGNAVVNMRKKSYIRGRLKARCAAFERVKLKSFNT